MDFNQTIFLRLYFFLICLIVMTTPVWAQKEEEQKEEEKILLHYEEYPAEAREATVNAIKKSIETFNSVMDHPKEYEKLLADFLPTEPQSEDNHDAIKIHMEYVGSKIVIKYRSTTENRVFELDQIDPFNQKMRIVEVTKNQKIAFSFSDLILVNAWGSDQASTSPLPEDNIAKYNKILNSMPEQQKRCVSSLQTKITAYFKQQICAEIEIKNKNKNKNKKEKEKEKECQEIMNSRNINDTYTAAIATMMFMNGQYGIVNQPPTSNKSTLAQAMNVTKNAIGLGVTISSTIWAADFLLGMVAIPFSLSGAIVATASSVAIAGSIFPPIAIGITVGVLGYAAYKGLSYHIEKKYARSKIWSHYCDLKKSCNSELASHNFERSSERRSFRTIVSSLDNIKTKLGVNIPTMCDNTTPTKNQLLPGEQTLQAQDYACLAKKGISSMIALNLNETADGSSKFIDKQHLDTTDYSDGLRTFNSTFNNYKDRNA
ncbi:MAG: hypothetical protein HQK53_16055 [Oligoflexia bacterium]|nr:hypothetical protein [Oligoflexia bacterium]